MQSQNHCLVVNQICLPSHCACMHPRLHTKEVPKCHSATEDRAIKQTGQPQRSSFKHCRFGHSNKAECNRRNNTQEPLAPLSTTSTACSDAATDTRGQQKPRVHLAMKRATTMVVHVKPCCTIKIQLLMFAGQVECIGHVFCQYVHSAVSNIHM